jgi:tetratricopeptide (TPR) repeat protein
LIDWSHDLLGEAEQLLFRRLAIFVGGCTLEAAETVCSDAIVEPFEILDLLSSLVDKSLVVADVRETGTRYQFLETTRAYALEKLGQSGETALLARKHAAWLASFASAKATESWHTPEARLLLQLLPEIDNVRAALHWVLDVEADCELAGQIAGNLVVLWQARFLGEGRQYMKRILRDEASVAAEVSAPLFLGLAATSYARSRVEGARQAVLAYEKLGDRPGLADSLRYLAEGLRQVRELKDAASTAKQSAKLFEEIGQQGSSKYAALLVTQGSIAMDAGRREEALGTLTQALERYERLADAGGAARTMTSMAELEFAAGNLERAVALAESAIAALKQLGDIGGLTLATINYAAYLLATGRIGEGHSSAIQAIRLAVSMDNVPYLEFALQHVGTAVALAGDGRLGGRLLNHVDRWFEIEGTEREFTEQELYDRGVGAVRTVLSEREASELLYSSDTVTAEEAIALALSSKLDTGASGGPHAQSQSAAITS